MILKELFLTKRISKIISGIFVVFILTIGVFSFFSYEIVDIVNAQTIGQQFTFSTPTVTTWTAPSGVTKIKVKVWGAGGSAGAGYKMDNHHLGGAGGGGGGYAESTLNILPGTIYSIKVGTGGNSVNLAGKSEFKTSEGAVLVGAGGGGGGGSGDSNYLGKGADGFAGEGADAGDPTRLNPIWPAGSGGKGSHVSRLCRSPGFYWNENEPTEPGCIFNPWRNDSGGGKGGQGYAGDILITGGKAQTPVADGSENFSGTSGGYGANGGAGGLSGRCGRTGAGHNCNDGGVVRDGIFPGGGGGGSDTDTGGFGANGQIIIEIVEATPLVIEIPVLDKIPTLISAVAGVCNSNTITLNWSAPSYTTGLTGYNVYIDNGSGFLKYNEESPYSTATLSKSITGLSVDRAYLFQVTAVYGSDESLPSESKIARISPCVPTETTPPGIGGTGPGGPGGPGGGNASCSLSGVFKGTSSNNIIFRLGDKPISLEWGYSGVGSCTGDNFNVGVISSSGRGNGSLSNITPISNITYSLSCVSRSNNAIVSCQSPVRVSVMPKLTLTVSDSRYKPDIKNTSENSNIPKAKVRKGIPFKLIGNIGTLNSSVTSILRSPNHLNLDTPFSANITNASQNVIQNSPQVRYTLRGTYKTFDDVLNIEVDTPISTSIDVQAVDPAINEF